MRVTASADHLAAALKHSVAARTSTMPVLTHVRLQADDKGLQLQTSDTEIYVSHCIPAEVQQPGAICMSEAKLKAVCAAAGDVNLDSDGRAIRGRSRFTIETLPADTFPAPEESKFTPLDLDPAELLAAINATSYAADDGDVRLLCRVVHVEPGRAWGTNGHMLARIAINYNGAPIRIPEAQTRRLAGVLALEGVKLLASSVSGDRVDMLQVVADGVSIVLRCLDGSGTSIDQLFPVLDKRPRVVVDRNELSNALRRLRPFLPTPKSPLAALQFGEDGISVSLPDGSTAEFVAADMPHKALPTVGVNPDYLLMILSASDGEKVELYPPAGVNDGPIVVLPENGDIEVLAHVVMPCRI